jgi:hypothetical protein
MPRGISVAGQGLQRREILRIIGAAAVASHFPGFSKWAYAEAHEHAAGPGPRPATYTPQFFTAAEFAVITRLTELIIPTDETPGAREAGVSEFVDFMTAHDAGVQSKMRAGVAWLDERARRDHSRPFLDLDDARQTGLLEPLAYIAKRRDGDDAAVEFFQRLRDLTAMGFYSSKIGYEEIGNPALRYYSGSPACPHVNDRAHVHLPPPKW